jgi:hypothetical protein
MTSNVDINQCKSYYDIGICMEEYGEDNHWKRHVPNQAGKHTQLVKRISFVYSCDTNELENTKSRLKDSIDFFFIVVKHST